LQLYATSGGTGLLAVRAGSLRGEVWFDAGRIVHARTDGRVGFEAFCDLVRWPHGSFTWRTRPPVERTIEMNTSELLLEAYSLWDEARRDDSGRRPGGDEERPPREESRHATTENATMSNIHECLSRLQGTDGFIGACLVDSESGMTLGLVGGGATLNLEIAAASNTEVVRAKRKAMKALNLNDDIEDILITLGKQYHLMRPLRSRSGVFFYLALDRTRANLAMARFGLADVEKELTF
jgi:Domain of unknown function (DUF4388)